MGQSFRSKSLPRFSSMISYRAIFFLKRDQKFVFHVKCFDLCFKIKHIYGLEKDHGLLVFILYYMQNCLYFAVFYLLREFLLFQCNALCRLFKLQATIESQMWHNLVYYFIFNFYFFGRVS